MILFSPVPPVVVWIRVGTPHWPRPSRNCPGGTRCRDSHPILVRNPYRLPTNTLGVGGIYPRTPPKKHTNFKTPNLLEGKKNSYYGTVESFFGKGALLCNSWNLNYGFWAFWGRFPFTTTICGIPSARSGRYKYRLVSSILWPSLDLSVSDAWNR